MDECYLKKQAVIEHQIRELIFSLAMLDGDRDFEAAEKGIDIATGGGSFFHKDLGLDLRSIVRSIKRDGGEYTRPDFLEVGEQ